MLSLQLVGEKKKSKKQTSLLRHRIRLCSLFRGPPGQTTVDHRVRPPPVNRAEHEGHGSKDEVRPSDCGSESAATSGPHWILCNIRKKGFKDDSSPRPPDRRSVRWFAYYLLFFCFLFCFIT